jgi:hypothetical protein
MSVGFYATLAGENADAARSWQGATRSWQQHSAQLEEALHDEQDKNWRLQHQLNEAHQLNASWQAHAKQLEEKVRNWQQSAIQGEAISRAKTEMIESSTGKRISEVAGLSKEEADAIVEQKKLEVIQEWGVDPWASGQG